MENTKINILGTEYQVSFNKVEDNPKLETADGYLDHSIKQIVIGIFEKDNMSIEDLVSYQKKVLRHEIVHGFLYESGLWNNSSEADAWAQSEEMTDWFAIQSPKMFKVFQELDIL